MNEEYSIVGLAAYQQMIAAYCGFPLSKSIISEQQPSEQQLWISNTLKTNQEAYNLFTEQGEFTLEAISDIVPALEKLAKDSILSVEEFFQIKQLCKAVARSTAYYQNLAVKPVLLGEYFYALQPLPQIIKAIDEVFLSSGQINENCSALLRDLNQKRKVLKSKINEVAQAFIKKNATKVMDTIIVERNQRYCVLLKSGFSNLDGLVHGESASKAAVYFEPPNLVALNNQLSSIEDQWENEVYRLLKELGAVIQRVSPQLAANQETYSLLDSFQAKAKFMLANKAVNAELCQQRRLDFQLAKHPQIPAATVVANSYRLDSEKSMLLLSGPNTGGKTVSLKVIALFVLASYCGLPILCQQAELMKFEQVFLDIGDQQSISASLSTFSSHLANLKRIIDKADDRSLVIIDELGTGTDPNEGAALAIAIVKYLLNKGTLVVLSTHYNQLKQFAYQQAKMQIAAMGYDTVKQQPTFELLKDASGGSYGIAIAEQFGIAKEVIVEAQRILKNESMESELLINELNRLINETNQEKSELSLRINEAAQLQVQLSEQLAKIETIKEQELSKQQLQQQQLLENLQQQAEELIARYKTAQLQPQAIKLRADLAALAQTGERETEKADKTPALGDFATIKDSGQLGEVVELSSKNVTLLINGMRVKTSLSRIERSDYKPSQQTVLTKKIIKKDSIALSVNLLGLRVEEALATLAAYLDNCLLQNLSTAMIIHGYGSGALKKAVWEYLKKQKYVQSFRLGDYNEGAGGVTVVTFKEKS